MFLVACNTSRPRSELAVDTLVATTDTVAIYDAGVAAYRAKNYAQSRRLWERAAALGVPSAKSNLGFLLYHGWGGDPDSARAISLWREAAALGHSEAHRHLADAILFGDRKIGNATDAYAHAVAARRLADREGMAGVSYDADDAMARTSPGLSSEERAVAESLGAQWAQHESVQP